jgi:hypothetical protein
VKTLKLGGSLVCFQCFVLVAGSSRGEHEQPTNPDEAARYLTAWRALDELWCDRLDTQGAPLQVFGAGQMAAVIRAYAPRTWARAERLVVDDPADAWDLGRVERYVPAQHARGFRTIVAVNPLAKAAVAERIRRDGGEPIVMPDTIQF